MMALKTGLTMTTISRIRERDVQIIKAQRLSCGDKMFMLAEAEE